MTTVAADLYALLEVTPEVTGGELGRAFRRAARTHHPDAGGDADLFAQISAAYETLRDPRSRADYDASRHLVDEPPAARPGPATSAARTSPRPTPARSTSPTGPYRTMVWSAARVATGAALVAGGVVVAFACTPALVAVLSVPLAWWAVMIALGGGWRAAFVAAVTWVMPVLVATLLAVTPAAATWAAAAATLILGGGLAAEPRHIT